MSKKELTRLEVMQQLEEKRLKQREAAEVLRHVRRMVRVYRQEWVSAPLGYPMTDLLLLLYGREVLNKWRI